MDNNEELNNEQSDQWLKPNQDPSYDRSSTGDPTIPNEGATSGRSQFQRPDPAMNDPSPARPVYNPARSQDITAMENQASSINEISQAWFSQAEINDLRTRWKAIQSQFVEEPCSSVEQGETLVAETVERMKQMITDHMHVLGDQWLNHDNITTEELRNSLLSYRSFLDRILKQ